MSFNLNFSAKYYFTVAGETEDDAENNKKELRPKRLKNVSGAAEGSLRPASALSGTSVTSEDRREIEEIRRQQREHDTGKITPDSQKGQDDKSM